MTSYDDVDREARHDWLDERELERERPDRCEYDDRRRPLTTTDDVDDLTR